MGSGLRYHIAGTSAARPMSEPTIYCDGAADEHYRDGIDVELSHWVPNRTPSHLKADTSTEICFKALDAAFHQRFAVAINNHVDVDGVLSVFVLMHPEIAQRHRRTLIQAAEAGDFRDWADERGMQLCQQLTHYIAGAHTEADPQDVYRHCFDLISTILEGSGDAHGDEGTQHLDSAVSQIERGLIRRTLVTDRLVRYEIPRELTRGQAERALHVPAFAEPLSTRTLLPPEAREKLDADRIHLVSVETDGGWYHDLWYPGYIWADTTSRWRPPGVVRLSASDELAFELPAMTAAVEALNKADSGTGRWRSAEGLSLFAKSTLRPFPIVAAYANEHGPAVSHLHSREVAEHFRLVTEQ